MNKLFTTLAVTGIGAALAVGASAQTFTPTGTTTGPTNTTGAGSIYTLSVYSNVLTSAQDPSAIPTGDYQYSYLVTLTNDPAGTEINQFNINAIQGFMPYPVGAPVDVKNGGVGFTGPDFEEVGSPTTSSGFTSLSFQSVPGQPGLTTTGPAPNYDFTSPFGPDDTNSGDSVVFSFLSSLPPGNSTVSLGSNGFGGTASGTLSGEGNAPGPSPATATTVPETSSFALLGLGLLPLALVARRRLSRNN